jgi:hypothetical protein
MGAQDMCRVDIGWSGPMGARNVVSLRGRVKGDVGSLRISRQGFAGHYHKKKYPAFLLCALCLITTTSTSTSELSLKTSTRTLINACMHGLL